MELIVDFLSFFVNSVSSLILYIRYGKLYFPQILMLSKKYYQVKIFLSKSTIECLEINMNDDGVYMGKIFDGGWLLFLF